jgi:hypothetical protein
MATTSDNQDKQGLTIAILTHEGMTISDASGPYEAFSLAKASPRAIELASGFIRDWVADSTAKYGQHV